MENDPIRPVESNPPIGAGDFAEAWEVEKLALERERLAFEKERFAREQAKRDREIARLDQEIEDNQLPRWRRPAYAGANATIVVALIGLFLAFGTDFFKSNIASLIADRYRLKKVVDHLSLEQVVLKTNTAVLQRETQQLSNEKTSLINKQAVLTGQRDVLEKSTTSLRSQKLRLEHEVILGPIRTQIGLLGAQGQLFPFLTQSSYPNDEALRALSDSVIAHRNDPQVVSLLKDSFQNANANSTKAALALILFQATGDLRWKEQVRKAAIDDISTKGAVGVGLTYYLHLFDSPFLFFPIERLEILRTLYSILAQVPKLADTPNETSPELTRLMKENASLQKNEIMEDVCEIAKWDKDATVKFRDPWFSCRNSLLAELPDDLKRDSEHRGVSMDFFRFSEQIYGVAVLKQTQTLAKSYFQDGEIITPEYLVNSSGQCPAFNPSFPLCVDWISHRTANPGDNEPFLRLWVNSFPMYAQWLRNNSEVASALLDPSHKVLSTLSDESMSKLLDGEWITTADLHNAGRR